MTTKFKLKGLNLAKHRPFTCEPLENDELFWPKSALSKERHKALFDYMGGESKDWSRMFVIIEHDGLRKDGTPVNGIVVEIVEE